MGLLVTFRAVDGKRWVNVSKLVFFFFFNAANTCISPAHSSVKALIYTLANFICKGTEDKLLWSVGCNPLTDPSNQDREISVTTNNISFDVWSSVLTIRALPINDGISLTCTVIKFSPFVCNRESYTLIVQG